MMLYPSPRNDSRGERIDEDMFMYITGIKESENTSAMYAEVELYEDIEEGYSVASGWISLRSNNFEIDNY